MFTSPMPNSTHIVTCSGSVSPIWYARSSVSLTITVPVASTVIMFSQNERLQKIDCLGAGAGALTAGLGRPACVAT